MAIQHQKHNYDNILQKSKNKKKIETKANLWEVSTTATDGMMCLEVKVLLILEPKTNKRFYWF